MELKLTFVLTKIEKLNIICSFYVSNQSRVVQQARGERSYHIFYQLCAGADDALRGTVSIIVTVMDV
jgi:myosin heavy subunit